jgi:hypothetical protein
LVWGLFLSCENKIAAFAKKLVENCNGLFKAAPTRALARTIRSSCFVLPLMQSEERKDRHNDDNQSDQIDNIVHTSLPKAPAQREHV